MKKLLLVVCLFCAFQLRAQWTPEEKQRIIEERIEYIAQDLETENIDFTTLFDNLDALLDQPIDLNKASQYELEATLLFTDVQLAGIMRHRRQFGKFLSIYELKYVDGFNSSNIPFLLPFVKLGSSEQKDDFNPKWLLRGRSTLILRQQRILETATAYTPPDSNSSPNSRYLGDPNRLYARYRYQAGKNLSVGLTAEKDPGEEFFSGGQNRGFDFYSAHLAISQIGMIKNLIIGDYQAQFGQGLGLWTGFGFRKSSQQPLNTRRFGRGFVPYTSVDENNFMRGVAGSFEWKSLELSVFYSQKAIDANLDTSLQSDLSEPEFTSLQQTGYHRTPSELFDKDAVRERVFGANLSYRFERLRLGVTAFQAELEGNFDPNIRLYNQFNQAANLNQIISGDYQWNTSFFQAYGEIASSANGALAQLHGVTFNLRELLKLNVLYRDKSPEFQNRYAGSFGERSVSANEKGWYHGLELLPFKNMNIQAYLDIYEFPWLSFRTDKPSSGHESSVFAEYRIDRKIKLSGLYRSEQRERNSNIEGLRVQNISTEQLDQYRIQVDYQVNSAIRLRSRAEYRRYYLGDRSDTEEGFMLYQDLYYTHPSNKWNIRARYALFETGSYNTRIYAYENDMRYQFTVPAYFGQGARYYVLLNLKLMSSLTWSFRLAQTFRTDEEEIGSGLDATQGPYRTEFKTQVIWKF